MTPTPPPSPQVTPPQQRFSPWKGALLAVATVGLGSMAFAKLHHPAPAPAQATAPPLASEAVNMAMVPPEEGPQLLAHSQFSQQQQDTILAAMKENRVRLAGLPIADAAGHTGGILEISCAGFSQQIVLSPKINVIPLPIDKEGIVQLRWINDHSAHSLFVGTIDALRGNVILPTFSALHPAIALPVIVQ